MHYFIVTATLLAASFWLFTLKDSTDKDSKKKRRPSVAEAKEARPLLEETPEVPPCPIPEPNMEVIVPKFESKVG